MAALSPEEVETAVRAYEVMVILDPSLEERTIEPALEKYLKVIRDGGAAVGKSPIMPGNPQLKGKDDVIAELIKIVRGFKK